MYSVIIPAGGSGERMQGNELKQFALLQNKPVIIHTIEKFLTFSRNIEIIVAIAPIKQPYFSSILSRFSNSGNIILAPSGTTRFESVKNALSKASGNYIAIHDAVRPLISLDLINRAFNSALSKGNAVPCLPPAQSIRLNKKGQNKSLNRDEFCLVQTPQVFKAEQLISAYKADFQKVFTDDASVVEQLGFPIHLIPGERTNIKITYPEDLKIAEALMEKK